MLRDCGSEASVASSGLRLGTLVVFVRGFARPR